MLGRHHQPQRKMQQHLRLQPADRSGAKHEGQMHHMLADKFDHVLDRPRARDHADLGKAGGKAGKMARQHVGSDIAVQCDRDFARIERTQIGQRVGGFFRLAQHFDGIGIERLAGLCQKRPAAAAAVEQWLADLSFQRFDVRADRGLGDAEPQRSEIEAAGIDDTLEHAQPARTGGNHALHRCSHLTTTIKP